MTTTDDGGVRTFVGERLWPDLTMTLALALLLVGNALVLLDSWPLSTLSLSMGYLVLGASAMLVFLCGYLGHRQLS